MSALLLGRFQPFHDGHKALFVEALRLEGKVIIGIRKLESDPFDFDEVKRRIDLALAEYEGRYEVIPLNVNNVVYGRERGYAITKVELSAELEAIRATDIRNAK